MTTTNNTSSSRSIDELRDEFKEYPFDPLTSLNISPDLLITAAHNALDPSSSRHLALIKSTPHSTLPLLIHNYTDQAMRWYPSNRLVQAARSLVTERDTGKVVARSFSKFFNYFEKGAYQPSGTEWRVVSEEKVDGSIMSMFWYAGKWHFASKAQFAGHHINVAWEVYNELYPGATEGFDKEKTYVFEVVHPSIQQAIHYPTKKLVLLSIIAKDGTEPDPDFDWSVYPFPRPRQMLVNDPTRIDFTQIQRMNLANEEGFVLKLYRTPSDRRPSRVKVKFETYLEMIKSRYHVSPRGIVDMYVRTRAGIHSVEWEGVVADRLSKAKASYIRSLQGIADDFKGEGWLVTVQELVDKVFIFYAKKEVEWYRAMQVLRAEGFIAIGSRERSVKDAFANRLRSQEGLEPIPSEFHGALFAWYSGGDMAKVVGAFVRGVKVPEEFQAQDAIGS